MKSVHLIKKKLESDFCVADATFGHYMLGFPIILNHIKVISFSINHSTLVQQYGNKIVFVLLLISPLKIPIEKHESSFMKKY